MTLTGNEPHDITLAEASAMTANFRNTIPVGQTIAHCFGKQAIMDILNQEGCKGIRIYYALDSAGVKHLVVVGVNTSGNDLFDGKLAERSIRCPQDCSAANPLNT